ncbi:hypothetical protein D0Z08_01845 [Nocardioides immobilis]|uniref:Uncharacterized protein n=1 Tax=Nocardioides immobilis TaxID=2049295 RepID=A0A417Y835_9ACTN|nr:hypothetical protein D0Z08_01845 [Nocardioides immobilis]
MPVVGAVTRTRFAQMDWAAPCAVPKRTSLRTSYVRRSVAGVAHRSVSVDGIAGATVLNRMLFSTVATSSGALGAGFVRALVRGSVST